MSTRYTGGIITNDPQPLNPAAGNAANGVFTMNQYAQAVQNGTWPAYDPYFDQTTLLLHGNGTNGAQNNTFLDSSTNNFTITRNGNTTQGTFSPFSKPDGGWGNYFDGTGDVLVAPADSAFAFGTGDFTLEAWIYKTATTSDSTILANLASSADGQLALWLYVNANNAVVTSTWFTVLSTSSNDTVSNNEWTHVAFCRSGTNASVWVNGTRVSNYTLTNDLTRTTGYRVGGYGSTNGPFPGYISNARVVKGTAVYDPSSTTITVPTAPLTAISGTSLLTCQSNRFIDNSSNAFAITRNGDVKVTPFSPFPITTAYDPAVNGGSGYFDGSGDYLNLGGQSEFAFGTGDYTIEFWVYSTSFDNTTRVFFDFRPTSTQGYYPAVIYYNNAIAFFYNNSFAITGSALKNGAWSHIALCRSSGSTRLFVNGVQDGSTLSDANSNLVGANRPVLGIGGPSLSDAFPGYISNFRAIKGTALYTTTFTPPTAPLTAVANTSLLCNFTNAGIFDNTGFNNLETVGNAQIDTTTKKYGTGSMEFDGTGDELLAVTNQENFNFNSGNFTIEMWVKLNSATNTVILSQASGTGAANTNWVLAMVSNVAQLALSDGSSYFVTLNATTNITNGNWYHIAAVRNGSSVNLYVNGTSEASATSSTAIASTLRPLRIGSNTSSYFNGFIDDLRITKGIARYTSNFTPPIARFPNQ